MSDAVNKFKALDEKVQFFNSDKGKELRLNPRHQVEDIRVLYPRKIKLQPTCIYCSKYKNGKSYQGSRTWLYCKSCKVSLCNGLFKTCFRDFHTHETLLSPDVGSTAEKTANFS